MCWDIWMFGVIQDSSPRVEMTCSPCCKVISSTGMVVPLMSACMTAPVRPWNMCADLARSYAQEPYRLSNDVSVPVAAAARGCLSDFRQC
jgi:hypothetical protein